MGRKMKVKKSARKRRDVRSKDGYGILRGAGNLDLIRAELYEEDAAYLLAKAKRLRDQAQTPTTTGSGG